MRNAVAQRGERVCHLTHDLALVEVKAQRDAHVLQVVIAAGRVGPVRARSNRENRGESENNRGKRRRDMESLRRRVHSCLMEEFATRITTRILYLRAWSWDRAGSLLFRCAFSRNVSVF